MKQSKLFESFTVGNMTIKNRIVMSPMCMYSCQDKTGKVNDWHHVHYTSRAVGQVGLIMVEATAVTPAGRISEHDLGIWSDEHVEGLAQLVENVHAHGAKIAIQLAHAGRKANTQEPALAPSPIPFHKEDKTPLEMSLEHIDETVEAFGDAARRAKEAGFDGVEIHAAHGYLINEFLSPLSNRRADEYGGDLPNRYRFLGRVIQAVKNNWDGPIWARISANEYDPNGNSVDDMVQFSRMMQADGVDLIDCSSGGVVPVPIRSYPGYQVPYAEAIRRATGLPTGAVGLITEPEQAEEIVQNERADVVFLGRELLRNPYWPRMAAARLGVEIDAPAQYLRAW